VITLASHQQILTLRTRCALRILDHTTRDILNP
jgi:hypothetical protein